MTRAGLSPCATRASTREHRRALHPTDVEDEEASQNLPVNANLHGIIRVRGRVAVQLGT